jgi:hypothetical protein
MDYKDFLTQDFGRTDAGPFVVGVVYNDKNLNSFYDIGEGLAHVQVMPDQGDYYAITGRSGGYVFPCPATGGTVTVTASGGELGGTLVGSVTMTGSNVKLDFVACHTKIIGAAGTLVAIDRSGNHTISPGDTLELNVNLPASATPDKAKVVVGIEGSVLSANYLAMFANPATKGLGATARAVSATKKGEATALLKVDAKNAVASQVTVGNRVPTEGNSGIVGANTTQVRIDAPGSYHLRVGDAVECIFTFSDSAAPDPSKITLDVDGGAMRAHALFRRTDPNAPQDRGAAALLQAVLVGQSTVTLSCPSTAGIKQAVFVFFVDP